MPKTNIAEIEPINILLLTRHNIESVNGLKKIITYFIKYFGTNSEFNLSVGMHPKGPFNEIVNATRIQHYHITMSRNVSIIEDIINVYRMSKIVKVAKIKIIHAHAAKPGAIARIASLISKVFVVYTPNNWYFEGKSGILRQFYYYYEKILAKTPNSTVVTVTDSEYTMISKMKPHNLTKIQDGIDITELDYYRDSQLAKDRNKAKEDLFYADANENIIIITAIIRLEIQKDPISLLKIARHVQDINGNIKFYIVGDGLLYEDCKKYIHEYEIKNVILVGYQANYLEYIYYSDYIIFTSVNEGLPLVLLQALYYKKNIISKAFRGVEQVLSSKNAYIYELDTPKEVIADKLTRYAFEHHCDEYKELVAETIKSEYSEMKMLASYESYFKGLI